MTEARYQILFAGEALPGVTQETLKDNLCRLFKSDRGNIERLFAGKALPLKRGRALSPSPAARRRQSLQGRGSPPLLERPFRPQRLCPSRPWSARSAG